MPSRAAAPVCLSIAVCIALLVGAGCDGFRGRDADLPDADVVNGRRVVTVDLARLTFDDARIEQRFEWFEAHAESVVGDDWHRRPYATFNDARPVRFYLSERASFPNDDGRSPVNYTGPRQCHILNSGLRCSPDDRHRIEGMTVTCSWNPPNEGWYAWVEYATSSEPTGARRRMEEKFVVRVLRRPFLEEPALNGGQFVKVDREGNAAYHDSFYVDDVVYEIQVTNWDARRSAQLRTTNPDPEIRAIMATPESFRDYGLGIYEQLAANIESAFADGSAIGSARLARELEFNEDPDNLLSDRELSAAEKEACLAKARADVSARIRTIKTHYREMYAAANRALPVLEMVSPPMPGGPSDESPDESR